jgi:hypothetical protein
LFHRPPPQRVQKEALARKPLIADLKKADKAAMELR